MKKMKLPSLCHNFVMYWPVVNILSLDAWH